MSIFHIFNKREELKTIITDEETDGNNVPLISAEKIMQLGSYDTIELVVSVEHKDAKTIPEDGYILYEDEFLGWREYQIIKVTDIDDKSTTRSIYAELGSVELDDHKIQFDLFKETSAGGKLGELLEGTRYSVGYIDPSIKNYQVKFEELRHLSVLEGVFLLAKKYRCEAYFTYEVTGQSVVTRKVNLITHLGTVTGKRFESDKDTTGIERVIDYTGIKTAIIPTGKLEKEDGGEDEELTISDVVWSKSKGDPTDKPKGQNWLGDPQALSNWGRKSTSGDLIHRFTHIEFDIKDPKELISMAWVELGKYKNPKVTYTLKVVDLYRLTGKVEDKHEAVVLGDTVAVIDHHFPTPLIVQARVIKIEENMIDPTQSVITLGDVQQTYTSHAISKQEKQDSGINSIIKQVGKVMQSANGKTGTHIGAVVPKNPSLNDTWIRPHPEKPKETQWLFWDGSQWVIELDTSVATDAYEKTKDIDDELANSKEEIKQAQMEIGKTLEKAESAEKKAQDLAKDFGTMNDSVSSITEDIAQVKKDAGKTSEELLQVKKDAGKALEDLKKVKEDAGKTSEELLQVKEDAKTEAVKSAQELAQVKKDAEEFSKDNESFKKKTETQITAVQGEISGMVKKTEYDGLAQTVKSQGTSISQTADALKTKAEKSLVDNLNKQVSTTSSEVKIMAGKVDSVVKTADANSVKISKQEQTAESLKTTISKVETDLDGLEGVGKNLVLGSSESIETTDYLVMRKKLSEDWDRGSSYTVQLWGEVPEGVSLLVYGGFTGGMPIGTMKYNQEKGCFVLDITSIPDSIKNIGDVINVVSAPRGNGKPITVEKIAVYRGNRVLEWFPSPEDTAHKLGVNLFQINLLSEYLTPKKTGFSTVGGWATTIMPFKSLGLIFEPDASYRITYDFELQSRDGNSTTQPQDNFGGLSLHSVKGGAKFPMINLGATPWRKADLWKVGQVTHYDTVVKIPPSINDPASEYRLRMYTFRSIGKDDPKRITIEKGEFSNIKITKIDENSWSPAPDDFASVKELSSVEQKVDSFKTTISKVEDKIETVGAGVNAVTKLVQKQETTLSQTVTGLKAKAEKSVVDSLSNKASLTSAEVKVLSDKVGTMVKSVDDNKVAISKQEQTSNSIKQSISKVETDLNSLDVTGRNLILGTSRHLRRIKYPQTFTLNTNLIELCADMGKSFTLSADLSIHNWTGGLGENNRVGIYMACAYEDGTEGYFEKWIRDGKGEVSERLEYTFKFNKKIKSLYTAGIYVQATVGSVDFKNFKLEVGTSSTVWSPAPEDLDHKAGVNLFQLSLFEPIATPTRTGFKIGGAWADTIISPKNLKSILEPDTTYRVTYDFELQSKDKMSKATPQNNYGGVSLFSGVGNEFPKIDLGGANWDWADKWSVGEMVHYDQVFTTPKNLHDPKSNYRIIAYTFRSIGTDNASRITKEKGEFSNIKITKVDENSWSPAPEDFATSLEISTVEQTVKGLQTTVANKAEKSQITQLAGQVTSVVKRVDGTESKVTQLSGQLTTTIASVKGMESKVTQLSDQYSVVIKKQTEAQAQLDVLSTQISSTVQKGNIISSINQTAEKITIDARLIHITGQTVIDNASIKSSAIQSLSADKVTTGTLNAKNVKIINLDVNSLVGNKTSFIQSAWNGISASLSIDSFGMYSKRSDGSISAKYLTDGIQIWGSKSHIGGITFSGGTSSTEEGVVVLSRAGNYLSLGYQPKNLASNKYLAAITINGTSGKILVTTPMEFENTKIFGEKSIEGETYFSGDVNFQKGTTVAVDPAAVFALPKIYGLSYSDYYLKVHSGNFGEAKAMGFTNPSGSAGIMIASDGNVLIRKKSGAWTILG